MVVVATQALKTPEAAATLRKAVWLALDLKGGDTKPARTIGTVVRSLGGSAMRRSWGRGGLSKSSTAGCCRGIGSR